MTGSSGSLRYGPVLRESLRQIHEPDRSTIMWLSLLIVVDY